MICVIKVTNKIVIQSSTIIKVM